MVGSEGHGCPDAKVDLWLDDGPANGLNGTAYEEVLFEEHLHAALRTYAAAAPGSPVQNGNPLFLHYAPHLVHDPYEVPETWLAKFDFIAKQGDDIKGLRQVYACVPSDWHCETWCSDFVIASVATVRSVGLT